MTTQQRQDAENWLIEVFTNDFDEPEEEIRECSDKQLIKVINREYDGGYAQFLQDAQ